MVLIAIMLFSFSNAFGQMTIEGQITNQNGETLIGAAVISDTGKGTVSDIDGHYSLTVSSEKDVVSLTYSYIGYLNEKKEINNSNGKVIQDVVLSEDFVGLDEVVVTGASSATSKKQYGNAISTVNSDEISSSGAVGVTQALAGKVAGALVNQNSGNPAGGISVTLRGNSTIVGSSDPLYIVDGVIMDNSSPELLDLGGYAQNRMVDLNPNDIDHIEVVKGAAATAIYGSRASNGVVQIFTKKGKVGKPVVSFSTSLQTSSLRKEIHENMAPKVWESAGDITNTNTVPAQRYKMQDYIFRKALGTDNAISIKGGKGNTRYFASGSYFKNQGIIRNSDFSRYTGRLNLDQIISDKLSVSLGLGYTNSSSNEVPNGGLSAFYGALTGFNFNHNAYNPEADEFGKYESPQGWLPNPVEVIETFKFGQSTNRFNGNFKVNLTPFDGFSIDYTFGLDQYTQRGDGYIPVGSHGKKTGWARTAIGTAFLYNHDLNARYTKDFGRVASTTLVGMNIQHDEFHTVSQVSDHLVPALQSTSAGTIVSYGDSKRERNIQGFYAQETFGFSDKFFLTGAIRFDASSAFGSEVGFVSYPKVSLSYVMSEESYWDGIKDIIPTFKVRASYGEAGNMSALGSYAKFLNYNPSPYNGHTGFIPSSRAGNQSLVPERQKETEVGFDAGFLNNRLGVEFTYYNSKVDNLLLERVLGPSTGFSTRLENVGSMTNNGIELGLRALIVNAKDFSWNTVVNFSKNSNEVNGIEGGKLALGKSFGISVAKNGYPLGVLDGYYFARDASGEILLDANGLPSRAKDEAGNNDRKIIADPNPDWIGSLINEIAYKDFSLRFQFDAVQGFDVFNFTSRVNSRPIFGGGINDEKELNGELPRGYNKASYNIWERYIEDGSFVKLRELALNYTIKPAMKSIESVRFYVVGRNLLSFDKYSGWDPEVSTSGQQNGVRGFDFNEVPIPKTIRFGLNLTF